MLTTSVHTSAKTMSLDFSIYFVVVIEFDENRVFLK